MTTRDEMLPGAPCWADLSTTDVEGSRRFYSELFGWEAKEPAPDFGGYWMFDRDGAATAGAMGSMGDLAANNTWKVYLCTRDMDESLHKGEAAGATIQGGAMSVADLGTQAVLTDPGGAVVGLWEPGSFAGFPVMGEHGSPSWFELHANDYDRAVTFYRDLFGYEVEEVGDTADFRYVMLTPPGADEAFGAVMEASSSLGTGGDHWDIYWHVDDATTSAERVAALGGAVLEGPDRTPYGVLVHCADPAGARFRLRATD